MRQSAGALFGARRLAKAEGTFAPAFAKTAKDCTAEWRAEQCKVGATPAASVPPPKPSAATPPPPAAPSASTSTSSSLKTPKECTAEWRADKAGMQARGVTEKAYVEQCRAGGATPSATGSEPKPTAAAPPPSSASTNRDASCASACAAKAGPHHDCGTRARPSAATFRAQRQGNAGGGAVC